MNNFYSKNILNTISTINESINKKKKLNIFKLKILFIKRKYSIKHIHDLKYDLDFEINHISELQPIINHFKQLNYEIKITNILDVTGVSQYGAYLVRIKFKPRLCTLL